MDYNQQSYQQPYQQPYQAPQKKTNTPGIVSLILAILAGCFNPCYIVSIVAIVLGAVGLSKKYDSKGIAIAGLVIAIVTFILQIILDICITLFSAGIGIFSVFI